jgi:hypothetical protein
LGFTIHNLTRYGLHLNIGVFFVAFLFFSFFSSATTLHLPVLGWFLQELPKLTEARLPQPGNLVIVEDLDYNDEAEGKVPSIFRGRVLHISGQQVKADNTRGGWFKSQLGH